jgi:2,3-dihydroxyphenylpropionate 1,2-dioxygenase
MSHHAVLGLSHSPLLGLNPLPAEVDGALSAALREATAAVRALAPELVVIFGPDHYNGFFHDLMPAFCIGAEAEAVGDFGTPAGALNVAADDAMALAAHLRAAGFDPAISRRMAVDHGFAQPLQKLFGGLDTPPVLPIFVSTLAEPAIPSAARCAALGRAVGEHFRHDPRRVLVIGSGGLSHDPPLPTLTHPDPGVRERIIVRNRAGAEVNAARQQTGMEAGRALAAGTSDRHPLNPAWDTEVMDWLEQGDWASLESLDDATIVREGGASAQETKCWIAAFACHSAWPAKTRMRWYRAIPELIAGFGILLRTD